MKNRILEISKDKLEELLEQATDLTAYIEYGLDIGHELDEEEYKDLLKQSIGIYDAIFELAGDEDF